MQKLMSEVKKLLRDFVSSKAATHQALVHNLHNLVCCLAGDSIVSASTMSDEQWLKMELDVYELQPDHCQHVLV